jgi:DNA polymerase-3 subunit beta
VEQLNIVGKRSGEGFVAHKAKLVNALSRATAERLMLMDLTFGRKGLLNFVKALSGSNVVKIVPAAADGNASGKRVAAKRLKVVCGATTSFLGDLAWIKEKTPMTLANIRISPANIVKPNLGSIELAEALNRVLPFTSNEDSKVIQQCVLFRAVGGKLTLVATDSFRLAIVQLDYDDGEGEVLVHKDGLRGIATALRKAKRVRLGFEKKGESLDGMNLIIDTEVIRYTWQGADGEFPKYEKVIPTEFISTAHLDSVEAIKAVYSFRALSDDPKAYPIDLTLGDGKILMTNPDDKGEATLSADIEGNCSFRIDGRYLAEVLKACGGMVDLKLANSYSPMLFANDGFQIAVMPMVTPEAEKAMEADRKASQAKASAEQTPEEPAKEPAKQTGKRGRKKQRDLVTVA